MTAEVKIIKPVGPYEESVELNYCCPADTAAAFSRHNTLFYEPLRAFARKLLCDQLAPEDIAAEIFIKLWQRYHHFATESNIKAFLFISTRSACLNYLKHAQRQARRPAPVYVYTTRCHSHLHELIRE